MPAAASVASADFIVVSGTPISLARQYAARSHSSKPEEYTRHTSRRLGIGNHGDRVAIGVVVQLALRPGQGDQFIERARIVIAAGQFVAHQFVEHRYRAIAVGLLGGVAQAQVAGQVRGLEDREGAHHVFLGQHAHVIDQTDQCRLDQAQRDRMSGVVLYYCPECVAAASIGLARPIL
jgi:hypothetical protein